MSWIPEFKNSYLHGTLPDNTNTLYSAVDNIANAVAERISPTETPITFKDLPLTSCQDIYTAITGMIGDFANFTLADTSGQFDGQDKNDIPWTLSDIETYIRTQYPVPSSWTYDNPASGILLGKFLLESYWVLNLLKWKIFNEISWEVYPPNLTSNHYETRYAEYASSPGDHETWASVVSDIQGILTETYYNGNDSRGEICAVTWYTDNGGEDYGGGIHKDSSGIKLGCQYSAFQCKHVFDYTANGAYCDLDTYEWAYYMTSDITNHYFRDRLESTMFGGDGEYKLNYTDTNTLNGSVSSITIIKPSNDAISNIGLIEPPLDEDIEYGGDWYDVYRNLEFRFLHVAKYDITGGYEYLE